MKKELHVPAEVVAQFNDWRSPRRGRSNPENQTNDVWSWLIQTLAWPHAAHRAAGTGKKQSPGWCFSRFGRSETQLPDGTTIYIGGEHEDHYDPDFYIYNDVVVLRTASSVVIYGYPTSVFPPTDFHSATLIGDEIFLIGGLRYPRDRLRDTTLVYRLQLSDFSIHQVPTQGDAPSWLYKHKAKLASNRSCIVCTGGQVTHHPTGKTVENLTTWEFDLEGSWWVPSGTKPFTRWLLMREDESYNELWGIECVIRSNRLSRQSTVAEMYRAKFAERGHVVDEDLFCSRFSPPVSHSVVTTDAEKDSHRVHRILVDGVVVRYVEQSHEIAVTIEGNLNLSTRDALLRHGLETYSILEGVSYKSVLL